MGEALVLFGVNFPRAYFFAHSRSNGLFQVDAVPDCCHCTLVEGCYLGSAQQGLSWWKYLEVNASNA